MATSVMSGSERGLFTAVVKQDGPWWIGWVEEIPGVNSQGQTRDELIENLRSALSEALEMNRAAALAEVSGDFEEVRINP
jgi:predicted RNase H-like HicB family nuclease